MNRRAIAYALLSALLFGLSTPAAKLLLGNVDPIVLAGLLYCGAGLGIAILRYLPGIRDAAARETAVDRAGLPWLLGAIVAGGILGPLFLLFGLARTDASTASLLLTFESAATALLARFLFGEAYGVRLSFGLALLVGGAMALAWTGAPTLSAGLGPLLIIAACFAWGIDNNLTRKVALSDPLQIVALKGLIAGPFNLALGLWIGASLPPAATVLGAGMVGLLGYGVSLVLFVAALRHLGAARTGAYFAVAPFFGAIVAVVILGEPPSVQLLIAGVLMAAGVWLHLTEVHDHDHIHESMEHEHPHVHDEHHQHTHTPGDPPGEPHSHPHRHARLKHAHPHLPDAHHQHRH